MIKSKPLTDFLSSRYVPDAQKVLEVIGDLDLSDREKVDFVIDGILEEIGNEQLNTLDPRFPNFALPQTFVANNQLVRGYLQEKILVLQKADTKFENLKMFLLENHENLKWAQNRWLIANPGYSLEIVQITNSYSAQMLDWLRTLGVNEGDLTIHLHVISNKGRLRLSQMGYEVPDPHWGKAYYDNMVKTVRQIVKNEGQCVGLFCDSSWIFNEQNFAKAPDGKPFVAFTFLQNRRFIGETLDITDIISKQDYETQKKFALRSERRKKYFDEGIFEVRVHASVSVK